ncbi:MAG: hypothetical protein II841_04735 [Bacteroidales bacterium]|nr:hypothetical protein [Bacteroidales bacterium]
MVNYYIFKKVFSKQNIFGEVSEISGGVHETIQDCKRHWWAYMYGVMDAARDILGGAVSTYRVDELEYGKADFAFTVTDNEHKRRIQYFMLLDEEGERLVKEIHYK